MSENIVVSAIIPATVQHIYEAWLSGEEHGKMIGASATSEPDGTFTAWDGYISGRTLEKTEPHRIVQSWRSTEFPKDAPDSRLVVSLEDAEGGGTRVTLDHSNLPDGQGASYEEGWHEHYFSPMKAYFESPPSRMKEAGEALEQAAEKATEAVEAAVHDVSQQMEATAKQAMKAVNKAQASAKKQALKAVKSVKAVQKKALAKAKAVGKKMQAALARTKKPAKKAKAAPKKVAKKAVAKKPAKKKGKKSR